MLNTNNTPEKKLQKEVADKYNLVGVSVGKHQFNGFGVIDLIQVDLAYADALVAAKFPHFILKSEKKSETVA